MRITYYCFPKESSPRLRCAYGARSIFKDGWRCHLYPKAYDSNIEDIDHVDYEINTSVRRAKKLLKKYGGTAYTHHCDRTGGVFEVTYIELKGNNSKHKYNRHL